MVSIYADLAKGDIVCGRRGNESLIGPEPKREAESRIQSETPHSPSLRYGAAGVVSYGLTCCLGLLLCLAPAAVRADNYEAQFNSWFAAQTNMQTWSADFIQTRTLMALATPLKSTGKVWVTPGKFRWELGHPPQTIVVRNPSELLILYPRFKRAEVYALDKIPPGPLKDAMALMDVSIPRSRAALEEHFQLLSANITNSVLQMTLQPKSESARQFVGAVVMGFHTNDYVIADSQMNFSDGSTLRNDFTNVVFNQSMDPKLFETTVPPDYTVVTPLNP